MEAPRRVQLKGNVVSFPKKNVDSPGAKASKIDINASLSQRQPPLAEAELRVQVTRIMHYGKYRECSHSAKDRAYRNISDDDIFFCLTGPWKLVDQEFGTADWKYRICGADIEGEQLTLIIVADNERDVLTVVSKF